MRNYNRAYAVLVILLGLSGGYWIFGAITVVDELRFGHARARMPFDFGFRMRVISLINPEGIAAGAKWGDTLLEFDGRPFMGMNVIGDFVREAKPGDEVPALIRRARDGETAPIIIRLRAENMAPAGVSDWLRRIGFELLLPLFCLCLGFWVAASRPHDINAWLLLAIMISIEFLVPEGNWSDPWRELRVAWATLCGLSWPVWMLLFGIYFPERAGFDRKYTWIKWLVIVLLGVPSVAILLLQVGKQFSIDSVAWLHPMLIPLDTVRKVASMIAISLFFASLGHKSGTASTTDARRRIFLVWLGAAIGLTPSFLIVLASLSTGSDFEYSAPTWALYVALGCFAVFPLTLAYVIVVQRAMGVRMVIRQGVRYALARGLLLTLRVVIVSAAITIFLEVSRQDFHPLAANGLLLAGALLLLLRRFFAGRLSRWLDKLFFREAYSTEQVLSDLSNEARKFIEARPLLQTVTQRISETLHVPRISVLLREPDGYRLEQFLDGASSSSVLLQPESRSIQLLRNAERPAVVYFDDPDSWLHQAPQPEQQTLRDLDAQLLLPLVGRNDLLGVMALGPKRSEEPYSTTDLQLLQSVASQTGLALENSRLILSLAEEAARRERFNRELEIAREVQQRLFPQIDPCVPGLDCAGHCLPALGVGGDYYDFILLPDGRIGIAIGDVSGKGVSAALLMASLRASLRGQTIGNPSDLATLMRNVNAALYEASTANRYATFFYAQYDPACRRLDFVNAGHNPPFVLRGEEVIPLRAGGPVVGLLPRASYEQQSLSLSHGDILLAYTDGINEAMTQDDQEWGEDRMIAAAQANAALPATRIIDRIMAAADAFTAGAPQHDDMTLVVVKVLS